MHFEILIEDESGKELLNILVPKIITPPNTFRIHAYKGLGRIPKDLYKLQDPKKMMILNKLPAILKAHGKSMIPNDLSIMVVVDCDKRDCRIFKQELIRVLDYCDPKPTAFFIISIEEIEAWLLGDKTAIEKAYPKMNQRVYSEYLQDSVIDTWEKLADITLSPKAARNLKKVGYPEVGRQKYEWAQKIGVYMDIHNNRSPSFNCFKRKLEELTKEA
jgi:hypothetical protein